MPSDERDRNIFFYIKPECLIYSIKNKTLSVYKLWLGLESHVLEWLELMYTNSLTHLLVFCIVLCLVHNYTAKNYRLSTLETLFFWIKQYFVRQQWFQKARSENDRIFSSRDWTTFGGENLQFLRCDHMMSWDFGSDGALAERLKCWYKLLLIKSNLGCIQ